MDLTSILTNIAVGVAGLALGALVNRVVARLPRERGLGGPAHCTRCGRALAWWQQLPLIGWLAQGGRGRCCGRPLHWIFPLNELLVAAALVLFHLRYGLTTSFFYLAFVALVLVLTGAIDWLHRSIYTFVILGAALATLAVYTFLNTWNQYYWPLLIVDSPEWRTTQIGITAFRSSEVTIYNLQMASTIIVMLPTLILLVLGQRQLVRGLTAGALKG